VLRLDTIELFFLPSIEKFLPKRNEEISNLCNGILEYWSDGILGAEFIEDSLIIDS